MFYRAMCIPLKYVSLFFCIEALVGKLLYSVQCIQCIYQWYIHFMHWKVSEFVAMSYNVAATIYQTGYECIPKYL